MSQDSSIQVVRPGPRIRGAKPRRWLTSTDDDGLSLATDGRLLAYRRLALRVIRQAMHDVVGAGNEDDRRTAQHFLEGSPLLSMWCELADLDASRVAGSARRALALRRRNRTATMRIVQEGR